MVYRRFSLVVMLAGALLVQPALAEDTPPVERKLPTPLSRTLLRPPAPPVHPYAPLEVRIYNRPPVNVIRFSAGEEARPEYPGPYGASLFLAAPFSAIAIERRRGLVGYSWSQPTAFDAERAAMKACGDVDCEIVLTVQGGCAAVAARGEPAQTGAKRAPPLEYVAAVGRSYEEATGQFAARPAERDNMQVLAWTCSFG